MNKKILLAEPHAVIGHTMKSDVTSLSLAMMSTLRQSDPSKGEVVVINNGEVDVVNPQKDFDLDKDFTKILLEQEEIRLAKMEQGKKRLSEIVERDRGIEIRKQKTELEYGKFIEDDGYLVRRLRKPNTGIEIGSYKKKPKKQKQRRF